MEKEKMLILDRFELSVKKYPDKEAVTDEQSSMTYNELMDSAKRIGSRLSEFTDKGKPIPVFIEKSVKTLAAIYGVIYSGCFYVPISKEQPDQRLMDILKTTAAKTVITDEDGAKRLEENQYEGNVLKIDELLKASVNDTKLADIRSCCSKDDLLYVIFTSGSTGKPKGIAVSQDAVVKFINHFTETFNMSEKDRFGNQAPFDFDVSVKDIYSSCFTGGTLVIIPKGLFVSPARLLDYICDKKATTLIWAVPALCIISAMKGFDYRIPENVNKVLFSGQAMSVCQLTKWQQALPEAMFVNLYGPTEITCNCTYYIAHRVYNQDEKLPLGEALPGRHIVLMDDEMNVITDENVSGEICVYGESISEGYYGNESETNKRFVKYNCNGKVVRMYKTGDLAYYGENHLLYFSGRKDFQIKHMGHRIELEEIEHAMTGIRGVEEGCCVYEKEAGKIIAFYNGLKEHRELHKQLKEALPNYMIPNKYVQIEQMPLTKNGKIDRKYLLDMAMESGV